MKLTNLIRETVVDAIMADVPSVDYMQQMQDLAWANSCEQLVKAYPVLAGAIKDKSVTSLFSTMYWYDRDLKIYAGLTVVQGFPPTSAVAEQLAELNKKRTAEVERIAALRDKVRQVIFSCTTDKQFRERLPEFEKYLPPEVVKTDNLPAVANVVAELAQAGWPKK